MICVLNGSCDNSSHDLPLTVGFFPALGLRFNARSGKASLPPRKRKWTVSGRERKTDKEKRSSDELHRWRRILAC
jgi:hypothetical protein